MTFSKYDKHARRLSAPLAWWRRIVAAGRDLAAYGLERLWRTGSQARSSACTPDWHRVEPAFLIDGAPAPHAADTRDDSDHGTAHDAAHDSANKAARDSALPGLSSIRSATPISPRPLLPAFRAHLEPTAPMDVIEAYVDIVRRAKGKLTLSEIELDLPDFELHLEDFVRDVFQTMVVDDERYRH